jgi:hypothetical protein
MECIGRNRSERLTFNFANLPNYAKGAQSRLHLFSYLSTFAQTEESALGFWVVEKWKFKS